MGFMIDIIEKSVKKNGEKDMRVLIVEKCRDCKYRGTDVMRNCWYCSHSEADKSSIYDQDKIPKWCPLPQY